MLSNMIDIIIKYQGAFIDGLYVTLQLCLIIWFFGLAIGIFLGVIATNYPKSIGVPTKIFSFFLSGIPILVFLFWLHYPAQSILNIVINPFYTAAFAITLFNIVAVSDVIKEGIANLPKQFVEVARLCNINQKKQFLGIKLPLIFRHVLPSLLVIQVNMLHMTLFASLISVEEIFRVSQRINSLEYQPIEIYTALGLFFLLVSLPINGLAIYLKYKFNRNLSEK
jgi:His/Glu/Gln/Arg/opine family amino acid ABC transporter permease subunit